MTKGHSVAAVVYNPVKVDVDALRAAVGVEEERNRWQPSRWHETSSADSGQAAAQEALSAAPSVVIVVGGDGTVRAVAEEIYDTGVPLALVPAGTGNLLARNLKLPLTDLERSVRAGFTGSDRSIDIGFAEFEHDDNTVTSHAFLVMAGIGLDASMAEDTNDQVKKRIGWLAYTDPIARSVIGNKQLRMDYRLDGGRSRSIRAHTVIVGNCGTLTANILLLPDAVVDDGLLDVVVLRPKGFGGWAHVGSRLALNGILHRSKPGRIIMHAAPNLRALQYVQARKLEVRFDSAQAVELDGDSFGSVTSVNISLRHNGLTLRVR